MRILIFTALVLWLGQAVCADTPSLDTQIDQLFTDYTEGVRPGYAIAVVRGGELVFARGYGYSDIAAREPITPDTAFNLASLSKQFTGAAVALEVGKGTLSLDDPLHTHWPGLPPFMHEITIAHLVYMTSGLKEYYSLPSPVGGWRSEDRFTVDDAITAVFKSGRLAYKPGTRWSYSNINYQLLARVAARLNGTTFADYMQDAVFGPLGMTSTWVDAPIQQGRPARATSYIWSDLLGAWREAPRLSPHYGGSGVFSTLNDLAKWDRALYRDKPFGEAFFIQILSRRNFAHDKDNDALGLVHGFYKGEPTIWYEGGDYGVSTYMVHLSRRDETVICLANFGDARCGDKARAVMDVLLADQPPAATP